ncbi:MAG: metallophosphoesterase [Clostridiales bacterium]|nr:metallophosphoesterase [Clostridiales bacterium]
MIEEIRLEQIEYIRKKRKQGRLRLLAVFVVIVALAGGYIGYNVYDNQSFGITYYDVESDKISGEVKLCVLADLHCAEYGEGNSILIEAVKNESPDLILIAGDMVTYTNPDVSVAVELCERLVEIAPVYYCYGNHEGVMMHSGVDGVTTPIDEYIDETGAVFCRESFYTENIRGNVIDIGAVGTGPEEFEQWGRDKVEALEAADGSAFKIFITHHPDLFYDSLYDIDADLCFAGHFHGGLIRLPGGRGLFHPSGGGLFPQYSGGKYELENSTLIVSRGLGGHEKFPRINNKPELIAVTLHGDEEEAGAETEEEIVEETEVTEDDIY